MGWQYNLFPDHPEEFTWLHEIASDFERHVPRKEWTALLRHIDPEPVDRCDCREGWEFETWQHRNHAAYNTAIRTLVIDSGARKGLKKALERELAAPVVDGFGPILRRDYALLLRDFLREKPQLNWFGRS